MVFILGIFTGILFLIVILTLNYLRVFEYLHRELLIKNKYYNFAKLLIKKPYEKEMYSKLSRAGYITEKQANFLCRIKL